PTTPIPTLSLHDALPISYNSPSHPNYRSGKLPPWLKVIQLRLQLLSRELPEPSPAFLAQKQPPLHVFLQHAHLPPLDPLLLDRLDRKSTRLNSSHVKISY